MISCIILPRSWFAQQSTQSFFEVILMSSMPSIRSACRKHPAWSTARLAPWQAHKRARKHICPSRKAGASANYLAIDPKSGPKTDLDGFEEFLLILQRDLVERAEALNGDDAQFRVDRWSRGSNSFGATCVLEDGCLLEKAAVNVTVGSGQLTPARAAAMTSRGRDLDPKGSHLNCTGKGTGRLQYFTLNQSGVHALSM